MSKYRTPDVYIEEVSVFPPSVAEVETAIPAFIGYTESAARLDAGDLEDKPTKITSFAQYEQYFGGPDTPGIEVGLRRDSDPNSIPAVDGKIEPPDLKKIFYYAVKMFFDNGGGKCYIVSVGGYDDEHDADRLAAGVDAVALEDEPTLLVCPEAAYLGDTDYAKLAQKMLAQCGSLKDRFAILDLHGGDQAEALDPAALAASRGLVGNNELKYGSLYYPFLVSSFNHAVTEAADNVKVTITVAGSPPNPGDTTPLGDLKSTQTAAYNVVRKALQDLYVVVPASGAVAGVYAATDTARGVWKAPANVGLSDVIGPVVRMDNAYQDDLNIDATTGKSINAIRALTGKGTLVWGARTLAGNDNEWRYVPVRRFFNMVEESVKKSTYWAVFEPNDANTWIKVRGMIENYLTQKWREGALVGATTKDAFFVRCGLGSTMTPQDILEGRMYVEIGMAVARPAEFIVLKFSHKLQTS